MTLALAIVSVGCSMEAESGEVRVEIKEKINDRQKETFQEKLAALRSDSGMTKTSDMNGQVVYVFGGVEDVQAFADKITFAKVVEVIETKRTIILSVE
jgi:hypothetical protein